MSSFWASVCLCLSPQVRVKKILSDGYCDSPPWEFSLILTCNTKNVPWIGAFLARLGPNCPLNLYFCCAYLIFAGENEYYTHALTMKTETESSYKRHRSLRETHKAGMETKMREQLGWSWPKIECDLFCSKCERIAQNTTMKYCCWKPGFCLPDKGTHLQWVWWQCLIDFNVSSFYL